MPMAYELLLVIGLCAVLTLLSYRLGLLTKSGSIASFFMGVIIGAFGSIEWLVLLIIFTITGFVATRYRFEEKANKNIQEGRKGERTYLNVMANGLVPALVAIISFLAGEQDSWEAGMVYLCAIAVAASDTVASELGVLSDKVRLITTGDSVPVGTDGGVSAYGTMWALIGATFTALVGWVILFPGQWFDLWVLLPLAMGFLGCLVDSVIGATWERSGRINKLGNNILSMTVGTLLGYLVLLLFY